MAGLRTSNGQHHARMHGDDASDWRWHFVTAVVLGVAMALMLRLDEIAGERMSRAVVSTQRASGQQPARQTATYEYPSVNGEAKNQTEIRHAAY